MIGPALGLHRLRQTPCEREPIALFESTHGRPARCGQQTVLGGPPDRSTARELHPEDRPASDLPDLLRAGGCQSASLIDRPYLGLRAFQLRDGHAASVGQTDERIARHALPEIRHHGLFVLALLDGPIQLRERDYRYLQLLRERLQSA